MEPRTKIPYPHVVAPSASKRSADTHAPPFIALAVDDEEAGCLLLAQRFRKERRAGLVAFRFAASGADALAALEDEDHPDVVLILSDLVRSGMGGMTLLQRIKEAYAALPVYMATSHGSPAHYRKALEHGVNGYQILPIDYKRLKREVFGVKLG